MKAIERNKNIDILRGISIFLVLIYHLEIEIFNYTIFKGGYLGVDIFFLISGYLITSILYIKSNDKKFNYKNFLKRRFLRIFPAYILLIFVTLLFGCLILDPNQLLNLSNSATPSILFISNIYFWNFINDYFYSNASSMPLLHTWSLSVEIQYYISISLIFIIIKKINFNIKFSLLIIGILSFLIALIFSVTEPYINFFGFQSRMWEFILGSFIFFYKDKINLKINLITKYIIYVIIFTFVIVFKETTPSLITLIFLIFISVLILNKNIYKETLDDKFFNFFGLISYSLYIWHYPIISFSEKFIFEIDNLAKFFMFLLSIFAGFISFKLIEKKLNKNTPKTYFIIFFVMVTCFVLIISITKNDGFPKRMNYNELYSMDTSDVVGGEELKSITKSIETNSTSYYNIDSNFLVIGNSHSVQAYQGFLFNTKIYKNINFKNFHIQISCLDETILFNSSDRCNQKLNFKKDTKFLKSVEDFRNSKYILLITRWTEEDLIALPGVIKFLNSQNKKIIIFNSVSDISKKKDYNKFNDRQLTFIEKNHIKKNFPYRNYLYLNKHYPTSEDLIKMEKMYYLNRSKNSVSINSRLKIISKKLNTNFFNLDKFLCEDVIKRCKVITDNKRHIMFDATGHMELTGRKYLFKIIHKDFMEIINNNNF